MVPENDFPAQFEVSLLYEEYADVKSNVVILSRPDMSDDHISVSHSEMCVGRSCDYFLR